MTRRPDFPTAELPFTARPRVRLPDTGSRSGLFPGWGPGLER
jgi:hypothetical protein